MNFLHMLLMHVRFLGACIQCGNPKALFRRGGLMQVFRFFYMKGYLIETGPQTLFLIRFTKQEKLKTENYFRFKDLT